MCAAGVGEDGVLLDAELRPLTTALPWFDPRRQDLFRSLRPHLLDDDRFDAQTGPVLALVGWAWSRARTAPADAHRWSSLTDLASVRWTGRPFLSETLASRTGAWSSADRAWADDRVALALGSSGLLPEVLPTGGVVGPLASRRLREAGVVADDAVVVVGGHDHPVGGWGVHEAAPGTVLDSMGTAEVVVATTPLVVATRREHVDLAPGILSTGTTLLRVDELARNVEWATRDADVRRHVRDVLQGTEAVVAEPGTAWFAPGGRGGGQPSWADDAPRDPALRASAVLVALAEAGRRSVEAVRRAGALEATGAVSLAGGWTRSPGWLGLKEATHAGHVAVVGEPEVTAVGAAMLAARALGWRVDPARALAGGGVVSSR